MIFHIQDITKWIKHTEYTLEKKAFSKWASVSTFGVGISMQLNFSLNYDLTTGRATKSIWYLEK